MSLITVNYILEDNPADRRPSLPFLHSAGSEKKGVFAAICSVSVES